MPLDVFWQPFWFAQGLAILGSILLALLIIILLYVIYRLLSKSGAEVSLTLTEHPGELTGESIESVRRSLLERGIRARVEGDKIRISLIGFYVEARTVSAPIKSIVYRAGAEASGIILAIILLVLFPPGWLLLALIFAVLYTRYSELRKIVELTISQGKS